MGFFFSSGENKSHSVSFRGAFPEELADGLVSLVVGGGTGDF